MQNGLFVLICPTCGEQMAADAAGAARCSSCGQDFIARLGHLIPVGAPVVAGPTIPSVDVDRTA